MTAITRKRNVPGYVDELGRFRPIRSASYIGSKSAPRKARVADRKKYSKAKAGDLGKARQARALEDPWDRDARLEREAKAAQQRERERIERQLENEIYGETSGRTSRGKGRSLAQFVRAEGGINTKKTVRKGRTRYGDSLENFTRKGSGSTGLVTTTAGKGKSLDYMHQAAREAGYDVPDMDDLLDALDNEIRSGKKTYSTHGSMTYNPRKNPARPRKAFAVQLFNGDGRFFFGTTVFATNQAAARKAVMKAAEKDYGKLSPSVKAKIVYAENVPMLRKNPDLLSMFANAAVGIASTLQINEMVKRKTRRTAPKKRGTTTAKATKRRSNPASTWRKLAPKGRKIVCGADGCSKRALWCENNIGSYYFCGEHAARLKKTGKVWKNPSQPNLFKRQPKGELYVLTIGSGDDLISVYLHDGDKDGFSKRFKTMAGAKSYATRNKVKLVENPKRNGIIKRAWARSRAASEYRRELRLEAAAERSRKRRQKAEQAARSNPSGGKLFNEMGNVGKVKYLVNFHDGKKTHSDGSKFFDIRTFKNKKLKDAFIKRLVAEGYQKGNPRRSASGKTTVARAANGKKAVARSAKPYKFKQGDRVTATSGPHKGKTFTVHQGSHSLGKPVYTMTGLVTTRGVKSAWQFPERGLKFAASAKKPRAAASRKNPKSTARRRTFEMFQGRKVTTARPMLVSNHAPANLDALGDLIELKIAGGPVLKFNGKGVKLCAAGGKLWIAGKRFAKANPAGKANEINPIGEIDHVVYGTFKPHHGDHNYTHYIHKLGEESGKRPILCVDREGFPVIRGGNYKIEARGIVD